MLIYNILLTWILSGILGGYLFCLMLCLDKLEIKVNIRTAIIFLLLGYFTLLCGVLGFLIFNLPNIVSKTNGFKKISIFINKILDYEIINYNKKS